MAENTSKQSVKSILDEDTDNIVDQTEIERIFRIHLGRQATIDEISRFDGIRESEWKILEKYVKAEEDRFSLEEKEMADSMKLESKASIDGAKNQLDVLKTSGNMANKEMKIKGGQRLETLKNMSKIPGMAGPMMQMPSVVPPMPPRNPMMGMGGKGGPGPSQTSNNPGKTRYIRDGRYFLVQFKD